MKELDDLNVGVDIESISEFKNLVKNRHFLDRIFTKKEIGYCLSKKNPAPHLAARFAGKEAVIKALSGRIDSGKMPPNEIEILKDISGAPYVSFKNKALGFKVKVSLSHSKENAMAVALLVSCRKPVLNKK